MKTLQVREVPTAVYGALTEASRQEHRSLAQQTLVTLERGLGMSEEPMARRRRVLHVIAGTAVDGAEKLPDAVQLLREDRGR